MNILYIGDIMARPGRKAVTKFLPQVLMAEDVDIVIAQAENVTHGKGLAKKHYYELEELGINAFTGGNHSLERSDTKELIKNPSIPVTAPANQLPDDCPKYKIVKSKKGNVVIVSLLGYTFPAGYADYVKNPLKEVDVILKTLKKEKPAAIIVNIHSDLSSEKVVAGHYLDGKVTAVIGDHWHVPSADARILPNGTAHITDVGMCGVLNSSLGVSLDVAINRWHTGQKIKNQLEDNGGLQFNAVLVSVNLKTGLANSIKRIQKYVD